MIIPGERANRTRSVRTAKYVVAVDVEMFFPIDDPSEPCYEAETVRLLAEIGRRAEHNDVAWLRTQGKVHAAIDET